MRLRLAIVTGVVALGLVGAVAVAVAIGWHWRVPARARANLLVARHDVRVLLPKVVLPAGAVATAGNPSSNSWLSSPQLASDTPALVDAHRFYRVAGEQPGTVAAWFESHAPAGSSNVESSSSSGPRASIRAYGYAFRALADVLTSREMVISVTSARGGGSAIRVDAEDIYWVPRPKWERVPAGVHIIDATIQRSNPTSTSSATVTDSATIKRIASLVNALPPDQPGVEACPGDDGPEITLWFLANDNKSDPLGKIVADGSGCGVVSAVVANRTAPALDGGYTLDPQLERILGLSG
jgi:hypothetical protein